MTHEPVTKPVERIEAPRLLSGHGRFIANVGVPGMLHCTFVRSTIAHGVIRALDAGAAVSAPGVVAVLTAAELEGVLEPLGIDLPGEFPNLDPVLPLAATRVRMVGDPIALVLAESPAAAKDAAELVDVVIDPLPAVATIDDALDTESPPVWPEVGSNVLWHERRVHGDDDAFGAASPRGPRTPHVAPCVERAPRDAWPPRSARRTDRLAHRPHRDAEPPALAHVPRSGPWTGNG